jgi:hypothetical protein
MTMSYEQVQHLLSFPCNLCTIETELEEGGELVEMVEPWYGVSPVEFLDAIKEGHFEVQRSTDGELRVWPNYETYEAIPEGLHHMREVAHLGLILDVMPGCGAVH